MPSLLPEEDFEDAYTRKFETILQGRGLLLNYDRDRAGIDRSLHLTKPGSRELSNTSSLDDPSASTEVVANRVVVQVLAINAPGDVTRYSIDHPWTPGAFGACSIEFALEMFFKYFKEPELTLFELEPAEPRQERKAKLGILFIDPNYSTFSTELLAELLRVWGMAKVWSVLIESGGGGASDVNAVLPNLAGRIPRVFDKFDIIDVIDQILGTTYAAALRPGELAGSSTATSPASVFLCYSRSDRDRVLRLYRKLSADGFDCWLDEQNLLGGNDWAREITLKIERSEYVVACLSPTSINKKGYVQRELRMALDIAKEQPEGRAYLIPVRLEPCEMPFHLRHLHCIDLFESGGYEKLLRSLTEMPPPAQL